MSAQTTYPAPTVAALAEALARAADGFSTDYPQAAANGSRLLIDISDVPAIAACNPADVIAVARSAFFTPVPIGSGYVAEWQGMCLFAVARLH